MASHADILDRPEPLTVPFWGSLIMHLLLIGGLSAGALLENRFHIRMGSQTGGGIGSVTVTPVASIPLPSSNGPNNPVANDTQSQVPTPPVPKEKAKPAPKMKTPPPNAIALKEKAPKQPSPAASQPNKFRDQRQYEQSQLYSSAGQRMSSPSMGIQGGGGPTLGDNSPFGDQLGRNAKLIQENVARNWKPAELGSRSGAPSVVITFTIQRDGSVANPKVYHPSGNSILDNSALRAVMDAKLPPLPPQFPRNQADVELRFELGK